MLQLNLDVHYVTGFIEGDFTFYKCEKCDYLRRINWKTGEMKLIKGHNSQFQHLGVSVPNPMFENTNSN